MPPNLFIPDHALRFHSLPDQYLIIARMRKTFDEFVALGYSHRDAVYFAYVRENPNPHEVATSVGAGEFYRRMTEYLRQAQNMVEHVIDRYLRPFAGRLDPHNSVANCLDPTTMLLMATEDLPAGASALQRQRRLEAMRQLAITLQLFAIETVDDEAWVADDLSSIDRLSWERLFAPDKSRYLWVLVELNSSPKKGGFVKCVEVFQRAEDKRQKLRRLRRSGALHKEELLSCRIAVVGKKRYFVYAANRRKRLLSTLLKLERGRAGTDRRGWKYVVVATQRETDGAFTLATPKDAANFNAHTRQVLWQPPLAAEETDSTPNPDSSQRYRDEKIVGRFHRPDNGRIIAGSAEQLTTTITWHMDSLFACDRVNHYLYRARQILEYLAPLWFPHRRDLFQGVHGLSLPGYGIAWDRKSCRLQLETWWMSQL